MRLILLSLASSVALGCGVIGCMTVWNPVGISLEPRSGPVIGGLAALLAMMAIYWQFRMRPRK